MKMNQYTLDAIQETLISATLDSGLRLFVLPRKGFRKKHVALSTHYGSVDLSFSLPQSKETTTVPAGIAHFLEHKLFEREGGSAFDDFSRLGASANAYTDYTSTTYLFSTTENFEQSLDTLISFVRDPYFTDETVEKEKAIIAQEIQMYDDMPPVRLEMNLYRALYHKNPVRIDIGGTVESIGQITKDMLYTCYDAFYHPANMVLFVTGDVSAEQVVEQVAGIEARHKVRSRGLCERIYPPEPPSVAKQVTIDRMPVSLPLVLVGFKDTHENTPARLMARQAAADVLLGALFNRSSALFERLYERRLINDRFSASYEAGRVFSHAIIGGETPRPEELAGEIRKACEEARRKGVPPKDIRRLKRKLMGEYVALYNSLEYVGRVFLNAYFKGASLFDYYDALKAVKAEDVAALLDEVFKPEHSSVSIVKPEGSDG